MDEPELDWTLVCKLLLYRLGGQVQLVVADRQGIAGKKLAVTGALRGPQGATGMVILELVDDDAT